GGRGVWLCGAGGETGSSVGPRSARACAAGNVLDRQAVLHLWAGGWRTTHQPGDERDRLVRRGRNPGGPVTRPHVAAPDRADVRALPAAGTADRVRLIGRKMSGYFQRKSPRS